MARKERKKSKKFDVSSWLPPRITRNRAKNGDQELLNLANLTNGERRSASLSPVREPLPLPDPPVVPIPKVPAITQKTTPKPPVPAARQSPIKERRAITEILNELYTNPDFPTVMGSKV